MTEINTTDHDLLIELRTEMRNIRSDIKELKEGTTQRIQILERDKADRQEVEFLQKKLNEDIENRIRKLEEYRSRYFIMMSLYTAAVGIMIGLMLFHIFK